MGPPSYMSSVVDRNVFMWRISVHMFIWLLIHSQSLCVSPTPYFRNTDKSTDFSVSYRLLPYCWEMSTQDIQFDVVGTALKVDLWR